MGQYNFYGKSSLEMTSVQIFEKIFSHHNDDVQNIDFLKDFIIKNVQNPLFLRHISDVKKVKKTP